MSRYLDMVDHPSHVRKLTVPQLQQLAEEIRSELISALAKNGGHLGPNLGVVELTIALHRVFESPRERIIWDTGHQSYVHKMLTGRAGQFDHLRQAGGLSGYPSRAESVHDWVENSHASTIASYAHGMATPQEMGAPPPHERGLSPEELADRRIVAVIGDGSMT